MRDLSEILRGVQSAIEASCRKVGRNPCEVEIVAVTKTHGEDVVREARDAGLRIVGENKVQEAAWKKPLSVSGMDWHLIGHLQRNKVRPALELFSTFHSIDSIPLIERMACVAEEIGAKPEILLEVNVSGERSKSGMRPQDVPAAIEATLSHRCLTLSGFMTMAPFVPQEKIEEVRPFFVQLRKLRDEMASYFGISFPHLSMGMTNDYRIAIEEGATWVRLGTVLFGERPKLKPQRLVDASDAGLSGEGGGLYDRVLD